MLKVLAIGDMHVTAPEIAECEKLIDYAIESALAHKVDLVVFLGDQFHTHQNLHLAVVDFWGRALYKLWHKLVVSGIAVKFLVGNHDKSHDPLVKTHAMEAYTTAESSDWFMPRDFVESYDADSADCGTVFVGYQHTPDEFLAALAEARAKLGSGYPAPLVFAHQEFLGAEFGNGFSTGQGVPLAALGGLKVVSGHIHAQQTLVGAGAEVFYTGSPRWRGWGDANIAKAIWVLEYTPGEPLKRLALPVDHISKPVAVLEDTPTNPLDPKTINKNSQTMVQITGPAAWVDSRKAIFAGLAQVRTHIIGEVVEIRESEGIRAALGKFLDKFRPPNGTDLAKVKSEIAKRLVW